MKIPHHVLILTVLAICGLIAVLAGGLDVDNYWTAILSAGLGYGVAR